MATSGERILDAAERCIATFGLRRFSMSDVAGAAGVSRATVYNHFADREALVEAVTARLAKAFVTSSEPVVARRRTLAAQVAEAAVFIVTHTERTDDEHLATLLSARSMHLVDAWVDFWEPYLDAAKARGEVRPTLDNRRAGEWIVRLMFSFAVMPSPTLDLSKPDVIRSFVRDHLVTGLS